LAILLILAGGCHGCPMKADVLNKFPVEEVSMDSLQVQSCERKDYSSSFAVEWSPGKYLTGWSSPVAWLLCCRYFCFHVAHTGRLRQVLPKRFRDPGRQYLTIQISWKISAGLLIFSSSKMSVDSLLLRVEMKNWPGTSSELERKGSSKLKMDLKPMVKLKYGSWKIKGGFLFFSSSQKILADFLSMVKLKSWPIILNKFKRKGFPELKIDFKPRVKLKMVGRK